MMNGMDSANVLSKRTRSSPRSSTAGTPPKAAGKAAAKSPVPKTVAKKKNCGAATPIVTTINGVRLYCKLPLGIRPETVDKTSLGAQPFCYMRAAGEAASSCARSC